MNTPPGKGDLRLVQRTSIEGGIARPGGPMRVLVIEDDPEFLTFLRVYIDGLDSVDQVTYASSGADGICLARESKFDVVVVDFQLQDMTGEEVASAIKEHSERPRIVGFSGSTDRLDWADTVVTKGGRESLDLLEEALRSPA